MTHLHITIVPLAGGLHVVPACVSKRGFEDKLRMLDYYFTMQNML